MRLIQHFSVFLLPLALCDSDADSPSHHTHHAHISVGGQSHSFGHGVSGGSAVHHSPVAVVAPVSAQTYTASTPAPAPAPASSYTAEVTPSVVYHSNTAAPTAYGPAVSYQVEDDCSVAYELSCPTAGTYGDGNSLLDCPPGEQEICVDVIENECSTDYKKECRDVQETNCEIQNNEICIKADQTTCQDTPFTIEKLSCEDSAAAPQCQSFETQVCDDPKPEQVCADLTQVECRPETINICKTIVHTVDKEECLEFKEPECKDYSEKMCYNGYSPGDCKVTTEEECHYVTKPCPYNTYNGCTPTKERVCNHISKPKCTGAGASIQCTTLTNQRCTVTPVTSCVNVPQVTTSEQCETKVVNSCTEVPAQQCLTVYKTECAKPETQTMCMPSAGQQCSATGGQSLTNRVCEGQQQDICFNTDRTVCKNERRELCFDIPVTTCQKKFDKKCFKVPVPPQLVQVPKVRCRGGAGHAGHAVVGTGHAVVGAGHAVVGGGSGGSDSAATGGYGYTYGK